MKYINVIKMNKIIELLLKEELTAEEISEKLNMTKKNVWIYLSNLKNDKRIIVVNDKRPYKYRAVKPLELLKQLYGIMIEYMKPIKPLEDTKKEILKTIGGMI